MTNDAFQLGGWDKLQKLKREKVEPLIEHGYPLVLGTAVAGAVLWQGIPYEQFDAVVSNTIPPVLGAVAILAGFQGSSLAIMMSLLPTKVVEFLRAGTAYDRMVNFHWSAIRTLLWCAVVLACVLGARNWLLVPVTAPTAVVPWATGRWPAVLVAACIGSLVWALASCYRISSLMVHLLKTAKDVPAPH